MHAAKSKRRAADYALVGLVLVTLLAAILFFGQTGF
jgi:hypothetical protein